MAPEKPVPPLKESSHKIDDPTGQALLADARDQMISVSVKLPNGSIEQRPYEVHLPNGMQSAPADQHLPVVIALDGTTANKPYTGMAVDNKLNAEADRDGFIAVYPLPNARSRLNHRGMEYWHCRQNCARLECRRCWKFTYRSAL